MSKCADCNELVGEEWSANNGLCSACARDELSKADTNQATDDTQKASTGTLSEQHAQHGTATSPIISDTAQSLDEILERYRLHANMAYSEVEDGSHTADEFKDVALPKVLNEAKQAITSLIKELVAEAKPAALDPFYGKPVADEFEQNLLKALEEV